jgi:aspartate racemase
MIHSNHLDGIILGCTELPLLLQNTDIPVEILDIAKLHIQQAVEDICA